MPKKKISSISNFNSDGIRRDNNALKKLKTSLGLVIAVFAFILYAQTISYNYVNDDVFLIQKNDHVKNGFLGIPSIIKSDYWNGTNIGIHDAIYRPASIIMFVIEWQIFPNNPQLSHLMNVIVYALSCWFLFLLLCQLFEKQNLIIPFICSLLYIAHPIHTEVVCYIKSR